MFNWRTPGTHFGANFLSVVSGGSEVPFDVKFSGKVARVCTQVLLQRANFSLCPSEIFKTL